MYLINKLVEYDPENKTLANHITGRTIHLQLPANLCFLYLVTHPGEIISQNQLMVVGWGERNDVTTPNTFYQAILTLRNALAEVGLPRDTVKTISRRGLTLSEATQVEVFTPTAEPVIASEDVAIAEGTAMKKPAWLIIATATLFLIALINGVILYKHHQNMPFSHYIPLSMGSTTNACQLFYAPNEHMQDHYLRLLKNYPSLCAGDRYVFLIGYSKTERIAAFVCNNDARHDAAALCTTHYFWAHEQ
ncbi:winged helix-turn-helix domain-containing protein [Enterobacter bugandensis]|uniref:winged helix-turn-helix domain-containing protein n=1 Tax=Enterobacter bugandensis TaxID=881260 RepID=UPI002005C6C8|nr:winged helix-turn-helix domain-containing protein [Enterobacter bugandensis]MCK6879581.1 winged helix-turn-helix domain-containing protein [Enterobacter bugandensis]MCU6172147.1 winged helix-turn-helix domain-containing protein [Enterobacter bugandensis]MDH0089418.1 winged helix-turn-helix domain-containing protein [Enterobacter bugandensis]MDH0112557.1 winged helix-turn-helix domain-containing protein [Enterobacter bugandensis]MDH0131060.1 winged helix-turn-helix domain-containing protein 